MNKARIIRMQSAIRARRAHIVRMLPLVGMKSVYMQALLAHQENQITQLRALLG